MHMYGTETRSAQVLGVLAAIAFACGTVSTSVASPLAGDGLELQLSMERSEITLHEPVVIRLLITNRRTRSATIMLGRAGVENIEIRVQGPGGAQKAFTDLGQIEGFEIVVRQTLEPNEQYERQFVVNEWYPFDTVGRYKVSLYLKAAAFIGSEARQSAFAGEVNVHVLPRNAKQLAERSQLLLANALSALPNMTVAANYAKALSYIVDPVAVPALERLLSENQLIQQIAIDGLVRIGTTDSVRALSDNIGRFGAEADLLITQGLFRIASAGEDPTVKAQARAAIESQKIHRETP